MMAPSRPSLSRRLAAIAIAQRRVTRSRAQQDGSFDDVAAGTVAAGAGARHFARHIRPRFRGLTPDARVAALTNRQPEYGKPFGDLRRFDRPRRLASTTGQRKAVQWSQTLDGRGANVWRRRAGSFSACGGSKRRMAPTRIAGMSSVRSQRWCNASYRAPYFRSELAGVAEDPPGRPRPRESMLGSWAGAMGQPQFMPSNFYEYAVDFSGDGRRDIWTNVPDVLGSMGNYLQARKAGRPDCRGALRSWCRRIST